MGRAQVPGRSWLCMWRRLHLSFHASPLTSQAQARIGQKIAWGHTVRFHDWVTCQGSQPPSPPGTPPLKGSDCCPVCPFPGQLSHSLCPWLSERIHLQSFLGTSAPTPSSPEGKPLLIQEGFLELVFLKKWENLTNLISVGTLLNLWKISHTDKETNKQINVHAQPGVTNRDTEEEEGLGGQQGRCGSCWLSGLRKVTEPLWASVFSFVAVTLGWGLGFGGCEGGRRNGRRVPHSSVGRSDWSQETAGFLPTQVSVWLSPGVKHYWSHTWVSPLGSPQHLFRKTLHFELEIYINQKWVNTCAFLTTECSPGIPPISRKGGKRQSPERIWKCQNSGVLSFQPDLPTFQEPAWWSLGRQR